MRHYLSNIYLGVYTALVGMRITFKQFLKPSVTHQYPYDRSFEQKKNIREIPKGIEASYTTALRTVSVVKNAR